MATNKPIVAKVLKTDPAALTKNFTKTKKQQTSDGFIPLRYKGSKFAKK